MARTKQTARKTMRGRAPRPPATKAKGTRPTFDCTYYSGHPDVAVADSDADSSESGSDSEAEEDLVPSTIEQACHNAGIRAVGKIRLDLEQDTLAAFCCMELSGGPTWQGIKGVWKRSWKKKVAMAKERGREGVYVPVAARNLRKLELVGTLSGTLMEKGGWARLVWLPPAADVAPLLRVASRNGSQRSKQCSASSARVTTGVTCGETVLWQPPL